LEKSRRKRAGHSDGAIRRINHFRARYCGRINTTRQLRAKTS
jgi:hypothetical protein